MTLEQIEEQKRVIAGKTADEIATYKRSLSVSNACSEAKSILYDECDKYLSKPGLMDALVDFGEMDDVFS